MSVIDLEKLLSEISPDSPCGENLEYDAAFVELEEKMKGTPEVQIGDKIIQKAQSPDWRNIQKAAVDLFLRTHDMRVAMAILRALLNNKGLSGLRDGLALLEGLIVRYWDLMHPRLDPEDGYDPTWRINILTSLSDREIMLQPLMETRLCTSRTMGGFSLRDIHIATGKLNVVSSEKKSAPNMSVIEAAFADSDTVSLKALHESVGESLNSLNSIESFLKEKALFQIPTDKNEQYTTVDFSVLTNLLKEIGTLIARRLDEKSGAEPRVQEDEPKTKTKNNDSRPAQPTASRAVNAMETINSREDIIRILDRICAYYETYEPASPVPLLLKRAMRLVEKDFFEIIQDLAPDSLKQVQLISGTIEEKP